MTTYPHPACMEPDGGEGPCRGYLALSAENEKLRAALIAICTEAADYDTSYKPDRLKHSIMEMVAAAISQPSN